MMKNLLLTFALAAFLAVGAMAQTGNVKLTVDMTYQLVAQVSSTALNQVSATTGKFDPAVNFLDVAGSFNGWNGENHHLTAVPGSDSTLWEITLTDLPANQEITFKLRIDGEWVEGHSEFWGDAPDRKFFVKEGENVYSAIFDNYYYGLVPVTVNVNMKRQVELGNFDPSTQTVDLAGTFNEWDQAGLGYEDGFMFDNKYNQATDTVYRKIIIAPVGEMKWKARIRSANETGIGWESISDRSFTVQDTAGGVVNEVTVWFNNDDHLTVNTNNFDAVALYPNPVSNQLTIDNVSNASVVELVNIVGTTVKVENVNNQNRVFINTSDLASGVYFAVIKDAANNARTIKVVKQ